MTSNLSGNLIYANTHDCNRALFNMSHPITTKISVQTGSEVSKETSTGADNSTNSLDGSLDINADKQTDSTQVSICFLEGLPLLCGQEAGMCETPTYCS